VQRSTQFDQRNEIVEVSGELEGMLNAAEIRA
jgi:hypothetical protein